MSYREALEKKRDKLADLKLEQEIYEKGNGFLSRPYSNYRFHNGYHEGFNQLMEQTVKLADALRVYEGESIETDEGHCYFADNAIATFNQWLGEK